MQKRNFRVFGIVIVLAMVLAACQPVAQPTPETIVETVVEKEEVVVTEVVEVEVEVEVEAAVDRNGAWLDTVVIVADPSVESAVARILADDIDVYAQAADNVETLGTVESQGLKYASTVGSYNEMTLSPGGPILENDTLNPFGVPKIREAMNYLLLAIILFRRSWAALAFRNSSPLTAFFRIMPTSWMSHVSLRINMLTIQSLQMKLSPKKWMPWVQKKSMASGITKANPLF